MKNRWRLLITAIVTVIAILIIWPWPGGLSIHVGNFRFERPGFTLGLDLQGGTHLVLQADMSKAPDQDASQVLKGVIQVLERRVNAYGVAEPVIQSQGSDRVIVEMPGVKDIEEAKKLIGQTAQLDFREFDQATGGWKVATATGLDGQEKELTGKYFRPNAQVVFDQRSNQPQVAFEFNDEGAEPVRADHPPAARQAARHLPGRPADLVADRPGGDQPQRRHHRRATARGARPWRSR